MTTLRMIRNMSWGVKGIRYSVDHLNKTFTNNGIKSKYGIQYPVVNNKITKISRKSTSINSGPVNTSINSYKPDQYNIYDISKRVSINVSGPDAKRYLDHIVTCDNRTMEQGTSQKSLVLNPDGTIMGLGIVNKWKAFYSLIMDSENGDSLMEHLVKNNTVFDVIISKNVINNMYLVQGEKSVEVIESIMNYLNNNKMEGCKAIKHMNYQTNINFSNQFVPNNSFSVINTPQGFIISLNKVIVEKLFNKLDLNIGNNESYETNRIETGQPSFIDDIKNYNPVEANLHSYFAKNYKYSKRGSLGTDFIGKEALFTDRGIFKRFKKTRVMMYSCGKGLIPPKDSSIYLNNKKVGFVTSSTSSEYLKCIVAMGYIDLEKSFKTKSFSLAREIVKKVEINGNEYFIKFL